MVPTHPKSQSNLKHTQVLLEVPGVLGLIPRTALDVLEQALGDMQMQTCPTPGGVLNVSVKIQDNTVPESTKEVRTHSPSRPTLFPLPRPHSPAEAGQACPLPPLPKVHFIQRQFRGNGSSPYLFKNFSIWLYFIFLI